MQERISPSWRVYPAVAGGLGEENKLILKSSFY